MKSIKISIGIILLTFLILCSCSKDDGTSGPRFSVSNVTTTINENPQNGTAIGTITTDMTGTLSYSITSQTVPDAFGINSGTGEVFVNDSSRFDFETNPNLDATVSVTNSSEIASGLVSVTLNNIDDIAFFLNSSLAEYNAAAIGNWVKISEEEYNTLSMSLNNVTKNGSTDDQFDYASTIIPVDLAGNTNITIANDNDVTIPSGNYCFAIKYYAAGGPSANVTDVKISSTDPTTNYENLGASLPVIGVIGAHYFVLKGNNVQAPETSYLGLSTNLNLGYKIIDSPTSYHYSFIDTNNLDTTGGTNNALIMYQGLSSAQKQWD